MSHFRLLFYSKYENMSRDSSYFLTKTGMASLLEDDDDGTKRYVNPSLHGGEGRDTRFWSMVSPVTLSRILLEYKRDFEMFDYSVEDYFKEIGVQFDWKELAKAVYNKKG